MGGTDGGQMNNAPLSGSSQYHGTAYNYLRNNSFDALTFNQMAGDNHLVRNNFGGSFGGPLPGKKKFFFLNYESLRLSQADTAIDTVPRRGEAAGDFSQSGTNIFDPTSTHANPSFDSSKPAGARNSPTIRDPFPNNQIPGSRMSPVASAFLNQYVPMPNAMGGMDLNMVMNMGLGAGGGMGTPSVVGAGTDSNNYMDVRNQQHRTHQGTVRVDRVFDAGDSLFARYSASSETGFMPQNLPGFGAYDDNLAQNGSLNWNHIFTPNLVNTASVSVSRLTMFRQSENNTPSNNIVSQ